MLEVVKDYEGVIDWNVGSLFAHDSYVLRLIDVCRGMGINLPIKYVFGGIPCIMQGGRIPPRTAEVKDALDIMDKYNDKGIGCRLTFSSSILNKEDFKDELCNTLMKHLDKNRVGDNGVIVSSDSLACYIRDKYPNLTIISSLVKPSIEVGLGNDDVEYYNKMFDIYDIIVVNPVKIGDSDFLDNIRFRDRVEFIANHRCHPNCPAAKKHYEIQDIISRKDILKEDYQNEINKLHEINKSCIETRKRYPASGISYNTDDIKMLVNKGFKHFKLEGRDNSGECFMRDVGDYIFNSNVHSRIAHSIMENAV